MKILTRVKALLAFVVVLFAGSIPAALTHTAATIDTRADVLAEWLEENNVPAVPSIDDESHLGLILTNNIPNGLTLPTDLGDFTIDLNGWTIKGPDGKDGSGSTAGENGGAAITVSGESGLDWGDTAITVVDERIGVQLWENGPYFATCNVGATSLEESGYYFWWGDTNGYVKVDNKWQNARTGETGFHFIGDNCSTFQKKEQFLRDEGWIDESGNLTPEHDAATAYLGAGWRMPTSAELTALIGCDKVWTNNWNETGVSGFVVLGVNESIFLPATGYVDDTTVMTSANLYWTSTPQTGDASGTRVLRFLSDGYFNTGNQARKFGLAVRAVRDSDSLHPAPGPGPAEIVGGNGGNGNRPGKGALPIVDADGNPLEVTLEIESESVRPGEDGAFIKSPVQEALEEAFEPNAEVQPLYDETTGNVTNYEVTVTNDITGPVVLPEIVDEFVLDLGGFDIVGADGARGSSEKAGGDGSAAIVVGNASIQVSIVGPGSLKGGNGGDGHEPGNGAPAIASATGVAVTPASVVGEVVSTPGRDGTLLDPGILITSVQQRWPWNGKVDVGYTIDKLDPERDYELTLIFTCEGRTATIVLMEDDAVAEGDHSYVFDGGEAFAGIANSTITVRAELTECVPGAVRLWPRGPFFAPCNLGAESPTESGLYFWWGGTTGYRYTGGQWKSETDGSTITFDDTNPTASTTQNMSTSALRDEGWIDENDNLTSEHDAAAEKLGDSWRMPTHEELAALIANCSNEWTSSWEGSGVAGRIFRGLNEYAGNSIFIPAAGEGNGNSFAHGNETGDIWSATPREDKMTWILFSNKDTGTCGSDRSYGRPVRPVNPALVVEDEETASFDTQATRTVSLNDLQTFQVSTNAWGEVLAQEQATVAYTLNGGTSVTLGTTKDATLDWTPTQPGTYVFTHKPGDGLTATFIVPKDPRQEAIEEVFPGQEVTGPDAGGWYTVILTKDLTGPVEIPDDLGKVKIDLNDWNITGTNGVNGSTTTAGTDGGNGLVIVHNDEGPRFDPSNYWLINEADDTDDTRPAPGSGTHGEGVGDGVVAGGNGGDGNKPGNGAAGLVVADDATPAAVIVGNDETGPNKPVTVKGGNGGNGLGTDADGNGIAGGNGGAGVDTGDGTSQPTVKVEDTGVVTGGNGGAGSNADPTKEGSTGGNGGNGGAGVDGGVTTNEGDITGGNGGNGGDGDKTGGNGGNGGDGNGNEPVGGNGGDGGNGGNGGDKGGTGGKGGDGDEDGENGKDGKTLGGGAWVDGSVFIRAVDPAADGGKWAITFSLKLKEGAPAFDVWVNSTAKAGKFKLKVAATAEGLAQKEQTESVEVSNVRLTEKGWVTFDGLVENAKPKYFKVVIED